LFYNLNTKTHGSYIQGHLFTIEQTNETFKMWFLEKFRHVHVRHEKVDIHLHLQSKQISVIIFKKMVHTISVNMLKLLLICFNMEILILNIFVK
jgi:hypothetical protein